MADNIEQLHDEAMKIFTELRANAISRADAAELMNGIGKMVSMRKVQLAYHAMRGEMPIIPFLAAPIEHTAITGPKTGSA